MTTSVLGVKVARIDYRETVAYILEAGRSRESRVVSALAVHGLMTGVLDREHGRRLNDCDVLVPDGQPVRWALNWLGDGPKLAERVYGPELTKRVCAAAAEGGVGVYLYGSTEAVVGRMAGQLQDWYPNLRIAGTRPSRFREATPDEDADDVEAINRSGAGVVFVGLGCPRQEIWAYAHRGRLNAVMVCVGAAFDFHAGTLRQAPSWMQRYGLEWLFRFCAEPRRLWRRYLLFNPLFLLLLFLQVARVWRPHAAEQSR